ncbi:class I SAM-dependent methyltransferase [Sphingomonas sp. UYP23]
MIPVRCLLAISLAIALSSLASAQTLRPVMTAAVADVGRPEQDRVRDGVRKPAEVLFFAGVRPGMTVAELASGGGYYTRLLAKAVGPHGRVLAVVTAAQRARSSGMDVLRAISGNYPNVTILNVEDYAHMELPQSADMFWTTENYHDFHNGPTADIAGLDRAVFRNLKTGGLFYVEDHSAVPGAGLGTTSTLHRMDEDVAKRELADAGFKLIAESDILRNPQDNRGGSNSEVGHFVTDRFMLRLKR